MDQTRVALCRTSGIERGAAFCAIDVGSDAAPPDWVMVFPAQQRIVARDGRWWMNSNPQQIVAAFSANRAELPVDLEHSTEIKGPQGEPAPAVGWITAVEVRDDGSTWVQVAWNQDGVDALQKRQYRYISPAFRYDLETREILQLTSAGLTNNPALYLTELARAQEEEDMDKELLKLLGLAETATAEDVRKAVQAKMDAGAKSAADLEGVRAQLNAAQGDLSTARQATAAALKDMVPRVDLDQALARATAAETKVKDGEAKAFASKVDDAIKQALKDGKIAPATEAFYRGVCVDEKGLASFQAFASQAPAIVPDKTEKVADGQPSLDLNAPPTEGELAIAARCGVSAEDFKKQKLALAKELAA